MSYLLRLLGKGLAGDFTGYLSKFLKPPGDVSLDGLQGEAEEHPRRADVHLALGLKQMELGRLAAARPALETAVRLDGRLDDARVALAAVLSDLGDPAGAVEVIEPVASQGSQAVTVRYVIGQLCERQSSAEKAAAAYRSALALDPTHRAARQRLAALELVAGTSMPPRIIMRRSGVRTRRISRRGSPWPRSTSAAATWKAPSSSTRTPF